MSKLNRIVVLLSTYNGELYINEQIDSLLSQKVPLNHRLDIYIRDDGSSDNTSTLLKSYENEFDSINLLIDHQSLGAKKSFLKLLESVDSDFYLFCDQDDIWLENKVEESINAISGFTCPALFFSNLSLVNELGFDLGKDFWSAQGISTKFFINKENFLYNSLVTGCTVAFNDSLKKCFLEFIPHWDSIFYHDHILSIIAAKRGNIVYSNSCLIKYRQHQSNVVGSSSLISFSKLPIFLLYFKEYKSLFLVLKWFEISSFKFVFNKFKLFFYRSLIKLSEKFL